MSSSSRVLRSARKGISVEPEAEPEALPPVLPPRCVTFVPTAPLDSPTSSFNQQPQPQQPAVEILPANAPLPDLSKSELRLLRQKQRKLRATAATDAESLLLPIEGGPAVEQHLLAGALAPTLIFAQYEAGTAVCVGREGGGGGGGESGTAAVLTCSHCFGDDADEWRASPRRWLLFYTGEAVQVECVAWDGRRDLALAKIIRVCAPTDDVAADGGSVGAPPPPPPPPPPLGSLRPVFPTVAVAPTAPANTGAQARIVCVGQPGRDDLEATTTSSGGPAKKTAYKLVEVSAGRLRGLAPGADPHDNSAIGALRHDAWTYWGHSGAPLVRRHDACLVGLHSSWDDQTAMRHAVPWLAIRAFLDECAGKGLF